MNCYYSSRPSQREGTLGCLIVSFPWSYQIGTHYKERDRDTLDLHHTHTSEHQCSYLIPMLPLPLLFIISLNSNTKCQGHLGYDKDREGVSKQHLPSVMCPPSHPNFFSKISPSLFIVFGWSYRMISFPIYRFFGKDLTKENILRLLSSGNTVLTDYPQLF